MADASGRLATEQDQQARGNKRRGLSPGKKEKAGSGAADRTLRQVDNLRTGTSPSCQYSERHSCLLALVYAHFQLIWIRPTSAGRGTVFT